MSHNSSTIASVATHSLRSFGETFNAERSKRVPRPRRTPVLTRVAQLAAQRLPGWAALRTFVLTVAGLCLLTIAAWTIALAAGLVVAGISLFVLEWLLSGGTQ